MMSTTHNHIKKERSYQQAITSKMTDLFGNTFYDNFLLLAVKVLTKKLQTLTNFSFMSHHKQKPKSTI